MQIHPGNATMTAGFTMECNTSWSLSLGQYHKLRNLNRITQTDHGLIVNVRYDPELGLLVDEPDHSDALV